MKTSTSRKATATKATPKKAAKGKGKVSYLQPKIKFNARAIELRGELHRFDSLGQEHNRYAMIAMILCERQGQFDWDDWAGQRGSGIDTKRATEVSAFLEENGYRKYDRSYVGKIWTAMLKTVYVTNASTARKNGEPLDIDASGLRNAIANGGVQINIAKDQNKKKLKELGNPSSKKKTIPTAPDMVTSQKMYTAAMKSLNKKIADLKKKATREGWKS